MDLTHRFTVPTSVAETWAHFQDIAAVGECFPGATVTEVTDDTFKGTVKVKLGPIAMVYGGSGTFVDKDEQSHSFVVDAKGKDKRGNGTAGAKVNLSMTDGAEGGTDVEVVTDLAITGKPAQFGRGVMQDVSDKLLGQFVACLEQRLSAAEGADQSDPDQFDTVPAEALSSVGPQSVSAPEAADPAAAAFASGGGTAVATPGRHAATPTTSAPRPPVAASDDALDLGATVLPVLIKSYWKQGAFGAVLVLVLVWLIRR